MSLRPRQRWIRLLWLVLHRLGRCVEAFLQKPARLPMARARARGSGGGGKVTWRGRAWQRTMLRSSLPGGVVSPRRRPGDGACAETDRSRHHYTHGLDAQGIFHGTTQEAAHDAAAAAPAVRFWRFRGSFRDAERGENVTIARQPFTFRHPHCSLPSPRRCKVGPVVSRPA